MSDPCGKVKLTNKRKRLIMTYSYTIEDLLVGKYYRSGNRHLDGIIHSAEKREDMFANNAYLIQVREQQMPWGEFYATVFVEGE
jgi:hypothetical protein